MDLRDYYPRAVWSFYKTVPFLRSTPGEVFRLVLNIEGFARNRPKLVTSIKYQRNIDY